MLTLIVLLFLLGAITAVSLITGLFAFGFIADIAIAVAIVYFVVIRRFL